MISSNEEKRIKKRKKEAPVHVTSFRSDQKRDSVGNFDIIFAEGSISTLSLALLILSLTVFLVWNNSLHDCKRELCFTHVAGVQQTITTCNCFCYFQKGRDTKRLTEDSQIQKCSIKSLIWIWRIQLETKESSCLFTMTPLPLHFISLSLSLCHLFSSLECLIPSVSSCQAIDWVFESFFYPTWCLITLLALK